MHNMHNWHKKIIAYKDLPMIESIVQNSRLVFGCGNILFGDDGFGPAVIEYINRQTMLPENTAFIDVGTSIGDILFDILLSKKKPEQIIIIDTAYQKGRKPGEIFEIKIDEVSQAKSNDFSLHQFPSVNMLKELKEEGHIDIRILVVQAEKLPNRVMEGLSESVKEAIPKMCNWILGLINGGQNVGDSYRKTGQSFRGT